MRFSRERKAELEKLVFNFRKAIESAKDNDEPGKFFRKFPMGQCGSTSDILAQYLIDNGTGPITYVNGTYYGDDLEDRWAHTWLVVNGLVIDITGDQFKYHKRSLAYDIPIYVGPMIEFYRLFEVSPGERCKHYGLEEQWIHYHELKDWYKAILKYLR